MVSEIISNYWNGYHADLTFSLCAYGNMARIYSSVAHSVALLIVICCIQRIKGDYDIRYFTSLFICLHIVFINHIFSYFNGDCTVCQNPIFNTFKKLTRGRLLYEQLVIACSSFKTIMFNHASRLS